MKKITINRNGESLGKYDAGDIRGMVVTGEIVATDLARFEGDEEWKPLGEMPEFSGLFHPIPYTEEVASTSLEDSQASELPDLSDTESPDREIEPESERIEESQDEVKTQSMEEMTSGEFDALPREEQEEPEDAEYWKELGMTSEEFDALPREEQEELMETEYWKDLGMTSEEFDALPIEEQEELEVKLGGKYCRQIIFRAGCFSAVIIFLIFLIAIMSACSKAPAVEAESGGEKQILRYLNEVLLEKDFGAGDGRVVRWIESPEVVLVEGSIEHRKVLNRVLGQLNGALKGTSMRLRPVEQSTGSRLIEVFMVPQARFGAIGRGRGFNPPPNQDGYVWVKWNTKKKFIYQATILIAVDRIEGKLLQHVLLEEMTQALGPLGDTTVTPDSVMYEKGTDHGKSPNLGEWDRRMLGLLYGHLSPGDGGIEVGVAFARFWGK